MNAMFRSLQSRNYRVWFIGALVSNAGTWMQSTAQNWVVLTLKCHVDNVTKLPRWASPWRCSSRRHCYWSP